LNNKALEASTSSALLFFGIEQQQVSVNAPECHKAKLTLIIDRITILKGLGDIARQHFSSAAALIYLTFSIDQQ